MTTSTYNTVLAHGSDAEFRAWGLELHNALVAVGLVNTADTGQIDFATVVRPAANTAGGYKMYRFDDSLQATAPIFIKIEYGTGSAVANPMAWITVGISTNGAGTLGATLLTTRNTFFRTSAPLSAVITYPTFVCSIAGYVGLGFKRGALTLQGYGGFHVCRSCDASGAPNADGVQVYFCTANTTGYSTQMLRFSPAVLRTPSNSNAYCLVADYLSADTSTASGLDIQHYKHYASWPRMRCNPFLLAGYILDTPLDTEFTATPVGAISHNYRMIGEAFGYAAGATAGSNVQGIMVWE